MTCDARYVEASGLGTEPLSVYPALHRLRGFRLDFAPASLTFWFVDWAKGRSKYIDHCVSCNLNKALLYRRVPWVLDVGRVRGQVQAG